MYIALIKCPECQKDISDKTKSCPHCGYPLAEETDAGVAGPQQVEVTAVKIGPQDPKKKRLFWVAGVIAVIAVIMVFAANQHHEKAVRNEYIDNLRLIQTRMLSGGSLAEEMCNLTKSVWYNTI